MKNLRKFLTFFSLFAFSTIQAQDWDKNYPEVDFAELIAFEKHYADSIDNDPEASKYYSRISKYRFTAEYLGEKRPVDPAVLTSMKNVFRLYIGNPSQLDDMVKTEYKFRIGEYEVWMPVQLVLEKPLKKEVKKGEDVKLYCLFLNEHGSGGRLFNTFLVSEFQK